MFPTRLHALMLASRRALEDGAQARAQREMTALLSHAPKRANRFEGGQWHPVGLAEIQPGDRLLVRAQTALLGASGTANLWQNAYNRMAFCHGA
ncbi:hypothetical protein [Cupriavidus sp. IDO]|uniref:hypothetical protein n=1 Tax=Cupriavidus sp. IDO TaxID=1539142 RepID=UPI000A80CDDD